MKIISQIIKKLSFSVIFLGFLIFAYFSLKKQIKNRLSPENLLIAINKINETSDNFVQSLYIAKQLLSKEAMANFAYLKNEKNKKYFSNIIVRTDKISTYNNHLFCNDEISFSIKQNKKYFENEIFKDFTVKFGYFDAFRENFAGIEDALKNLEISETGTFLFTDFKAKSYSLKLLSIKRKTEPKNNPGYFWHTPYEKTEKIKCFDILNINLTIENPVEEQIYSENIKFNLGENFLPNWTERLILEEEKGDFTFFLTENNLSEDPGRFFENFLKEKKNQNLLKNNKIFILKIKHNDFTKASLVPLLENIKNTKQIAESF